MEDAETEKLLPGEAEGTEKNAYRFSLPHELSLRLTRWGEEKRRSPAYVLMAALCVWLSRQSGQGDAVMIVPHRSRDGAELAGLDCRTLVTPFRLRVVDEWSMDELVEACRQEHILTSSHKGDGMEQILRQLKNAGLAGGLTDAFTLNIYNWQLRSELPFDIRMSMAGGMHNQCTVNITRFREDWELLYDVRKGLWDERYVRFFHESLTRLIGRVLDGKGTVGGLELPGAEERDFLEHVRGRELPFAPNETIPSLFREAAKQYADRPAVYAGEDALTYRELDRASNRVANALLARGIGNGQPVMFKLRRTVRLLPVLLGILKSGAAFIPVDPDYPQDRISYIQENSGACAMILDRELLAEEKADCPLLAADELLGWPDSADPMTEIPREQLAYCIYTSGTTGRPKGALLSHRGIVSITRPGSNPFNRDVTAHAHGLLATGSVCFDISLFEFFVPLLNGLFLELAPESAMADAQALAGLLDRHGADLLHCTPSRLAAYLRNNAFAAAMTRVQAILSAGEALPGTLVRNLGRYGVRVYNGYGPTETTIGATITEAGDDRTIGRPIANTGILVLDGKGRLLPAGAAGELYIYGAGMGLGYRNLPEMTAQRFVTLYDRKLYRTGDLGRVLPDGRIAYLGRNDAQVKLRGLRIELPEIENSVMAFPGVAAACVQVRRIGAGEHLAAFYALKDGAADDREGLLSFLRGRLTQYMVPDILVRLDAMPQTPGGKTDLRAVAAIPVTVERSYTPPETPEQAAICEAMAQVLGEERVGLHDNFFEIGGDSLHTAELVHEIGRRLPGMRLTHSDIFRHPTPELLAAALFREEKRETADPIAALDYTAVHRLLREERPRREGGTGLGHVLLTGATGFLGMHILIELLRHPDRWETVTCVVRPTKRQDELKRLRSTLFYYAEDDFSGFIGTRLRAVNGDLSREGIFSAPYGERVDTVINCAANVSHFAFDDRLERVNTEGVRRMLDFCLEKGAQMVQVSTISVGGVFPGATERLPVLTERDLYLGQRISSQYILSKYMAEYEVLRCAAEKGLRVKLMRVGNLQGRVSDGEFQLNRSSNAFSRQIASYARLGMAPESVWRSSVNFSPVDEVARMIVALSAEDGSLTAYHVFPEQEVPCGWLFANLERVGHPVRRLSDGAFERETDRLAETPRGRALLEGLLVEKPDLRVKTTPVSPALTVACLTRLGLRWTPVTEEYLLKYFRALEGLGAFEEEEL